MPVFSIMNITTKTIHQLLIIKLTIFSLIPSLVEQCWNYNLYIQFYHYQLNDQFLINISFSMSAFYLKSILQSIILVSTFSTHCRRAYHSYYSIYLSLYLFTNLLFHHCFYFCISLSKALRLCFFLFVIIYLLFFQ